MKGVKFTEDTYNVSSSSSYWSDVWRTWKVGSRYQLSKHLGKGSYGQVTMAKDSVTDRYVAIKQMKRVFDQPLRTSAKRAYREMRILRHLRHPAVVELVDVVSSTIDDSFLSASAQTTTATVTTSSISAATFNSALSPDSGLGDIYLVFEFVQTDLQKLIKNADCTLSMGNIQFIMYQMLDALNFIHGSNIIHRDLKPANVLINTSDCTIKIADFGLSRVVGGDRVVRKYTEAENDSIQTEVKSMSVHLGTAAIEDLSLPPPPTAVAAAVGEAPAAAAVLAAAPPLLEHSLAAPAAALAAPIAAATAATEEDPLAPVSLSRSLTEHVVTRWYRAPEIILSQQYTSAVDIWSVGCIYAELLGICSSNSAALNRRPLFPGRRCGDLSADREEAKSSFLQADSQLNLIFDVIGTPSTDDLFQTVDAPTAELVSSLLQRTGKGFQSMFFDCNEHALQLLQSMLHFNPQQRVTAELALAHDLFTEYDAKDDTAISAARELLSGVIAPSSQSTAEAAEVAAAFEAYRQSCKRVARQRNDDAVVAVSTATEVSAAAQKMAATPSTTTATTSTTTSTATTAAIPTTAVTDVVTDTATAVFGAASVLAHDASPQLHPTELDVELEMIGESKANIRENIIKEVLLYRRKEALLKASSETLEKL